jgi:hypothetical protein
MPSCHHCGAEPPLPDPLHEGKCTICGQTKAAFCAICGFWEVGAPDLDDESLDKAQTALAPKMTAVLSCTDDVAESAPVIDYCQLMQEQKTCAAALYTAADHTYTFWREATTWAEAVAKAVHWIDGFFDDPASDAAKRMRAMLIVYLSSFELCLRHQLRRMAEDSTTAPLSLHDISSVAAAHFRAGLGFGASADFDADAAVLKHVDTIEHWSKGTMKPAMAAFLLRETFGSPAAALKAANEALLIYLAHITTVHPFEGQILPSPGTFNPSSNKASGIYPRDHIDSLFLDSMADRKISMALTLRFSELIQLIAKMPDFAGRPFRFNTTTSNGKVTSNARLSGNQQQYLSSLPDLDADDCPAACARVIRERTLSMLAALMEGVGKSKAITTALARISDFNLLYDKQNAEAVLNKFIAFGQKGRLFLQTSANSVSFIKTKNYRGLWGVYSKDTALAAVVTPCPGSGEILSVVDYRKSQAEAASDDRKKSLFQYMSWRVQKDRIAHGFFPMNPLDYEVTAEVSQSFEAPRPQATYGKEMIVWTPALVSCCTFKIRDSGRPTRSFLQLLHDLLAEGTAETRTAILSFLILTLRSGGLMNRYESLIGEHELCVFSPSSIPRMIDVEAHIYAQVTLDDVFAIVHPASSATVDQRLVQMNSDFPRKGIVLYNEEKWSEAGQITDEQAEIFGDLARIGY